MTKIEVTENEAKHLKFIYRQQYEESRRVKTTSLAKFFGVRPASVTEVLRNLSRKKLVIHHRYRGVELTPKGIKITQKLLRKHRILEVLLANFLGHDKEKACQEASRLDYHVSEELVNSICRAYGHPRLCPCNKPIFPDPKCEEVR